MTTISWGKVFRSPQAVVSLLTAIVTTAGTAGIIDTKLAGSIQALLVAVLGVISAVTHVTVTTKLNARWVAKQLKAGESE